MGAVAERHPRHEAGRAFLHGRRLAEGTPMQFVQTLAALATFCLWTLAALAAGMWAERKRAERAQRLRIARLVADAKHASRTAEKAWADNSALRKETVRK